MGDVSIRLVAAIALLFNVLMVVVAIIAIALTVPRDDPALCAEQVLQTLAGFKEYATTGTLLVL